MIYFDNAATGGHKPDCIINCVTAAIKNCANPGRSGHALSVACLERVNACRNALCSFLGGYSPERTVFTKNCTEALNIALFGILKKGDRVITTVAEHNSVLRPLHKLKTVGVCVDVVGLNEDGEIDLTALLSKVKQDTRAVIITLASNVTGIAPDVKKLKGLLPTSTLLICDGAQACGHVKVDMKESGIDVLAVAGHKGMLAIQGSGALLFSDRVSISPISYGGTGSESFNLDMPDFYPDALESGTVSYPAILSLGEGVIYLKNRIYEHADKTRHLTAMLCSGLEKVSSIELFSSPNPYGIVSFRHERYSSETVAQILSDDYSICVRGGLHCAPLMHAALRSDGLVRASLNAFNSEREVYTFLHAVNSI